MIEAKELQDHKSTVAKKGGRQDNVSARSELLNRLDLDTPKATLQSALDRFGFLFCHYEEQGFWWELLVLMRKLTFAVIVNLPRAPEQQTVLGILCLLPYIMLVFRNKPYVDAYLDTMDLVGTTLSAALALTGLILFGGYDTRLTPFESSIIQITLIMVVMAFLVAYVVYDSIPKFQLLFRQQRQRLRLKRLVQARSLFMDDEGNNKNVPGSGSPRSCDPINIPESQGSSRAKRRPPAKRRSTLLNLLGGLVAQTDDAPSSAESSVRTIQVRKRAPVKRRSTVDRLLGSLGSRSSSAASLATSGRRLRSLEDNLALLRAAVTCMVSPKRHKILAELRQDLTEVSYQETCRCDDVRSIRLQSLSLLAMSA